MNLRIRFAEQTWFAESVGVCDHSGEGRLLCPAEMALQERDLVHSMACRIAVAGRVSAYVDEDALMNSEAGGWRPYKESVGTKINAIQEVVRGAGGTAQACE